MEPRHQSAQALEPLFARVLGEPGLAVEGSNAIDQVLRATESIVAEITEAARLEAAGLELGARQAADRAIAARRARLRALRVELLDRACVLAAQFEGMLDRLERAEAELAPVAGVTPVASPAPAQSVPPPQFAPAFPAPQNAPAAQAPSPATEMPAAPVLGMRATMADGRRVTVSHEVDATAARLAEQLATLQPVQGFAQPSVERAEDAVHQEPQPQKRRWWRRKPGEAA